MTIRPCLPYRDRLPRPLAALPFAALALVVVVAAWGAPALGQEPAPSGSAPVDATAAAVPEAPPELPPVSELVTEALELGGKTEDDLDAVRELTAEVADLEPFVADLEQRVGDLSERLGEVLTHEYVSDDQVATLGAEADYLAARVDTGLERAADRLAALDALRREWLDRRELWTRWRASLGDDPQYLDAYSGEISGALAHIDRVTAAIDEALPEVVALQRRLRSAGADARRLRERALGYLGTWRDNLFRRSAPVLLSAEYRRRFGPDLRREIVRGVTEVWRDASSGRSTRLLQPRQSGILLLQVAIALLVGGFARSRRPWVADDSRWAMVLDHPWAIGVLVAAGAGAMLHGPLPALERLAIETATAIATCRVAAGMFRNPFKRRTVYGVSLLYVLFAALEAFSVPAPLLRPILVALAFLGAAGFAVAAKSAAASAWTHQKGFRWLLRVGAVALAGIGVAEVLGYHFLAQWALEAAVATAFVVFVVTFLLRLARGSLRAALLSKRAGRNPFLARAGGPLADRLIFLVKLVLVVGAGFYIVSIWDFVESPGQAWSELVGAGFRVGEWEVTVGRALTAVIAVYLAFAISWTLRALLDQAFFDRRHLERGVKDSISTLLHYVVLVLGFFVALSIFGFDMTNLALVAGALSVGIGFGLQNVVNNFVSGLILLFERPVRVGDVVVVGDVWGSVEKIGLRSTVIMTFNGSEMIVPNADLISEKVTNWTLSTPSVRLVMPIGVAYGNDPERVIEVLEEIANAHPLALAEPPPAAIFTGFGDSSLDFELRVWLGAFDQLLRARSELASALVRRFGEESITIPFPQRDVWLRREPEAAAPDPDAT